MRPVSLAQQVNELTIDLSDVCLEREDSYMVFNERRNYMESYRFCSAAGAEMAAPATVEEMGRLFNVTEPFNKPVVSGEKCRVISLS